MFSNTSSSASHVKHKFGRKEFARTKPLHSAQAFSIMMFACHRVEVHLPLPCPSASRLPHVIVRHLRGSRCAMMLKCIDLCHKSFQYLLSLHQCTHCKRLSPMALSCMAVWTLRAAHSAACFIASMIGCSTTVSCAAAEELHISIRCRRMLAVNRSHEIF